MAKDEDDLDRSAEWEPVATPKKTGKSSAPKPVRAPVPPPVAAPVTPASEEDLDRSAEWAAVTQRSNKTKAASAEPAAKTASDICKQFELGDEAKKLLRDGQTPRQYLDLLIDKKLHQDAACFWVHALPKREAVWWACLCVRQALGGKLTSKDLAALHAAERWCANPSDDNRRAAMPAAQAAGFNTAAGWAATAAFWSGGSLSAQGEPAMPPDELLTAHAVKGAHTLAIGQTDTTTAAKMYRYFVTLGIEVADGKKRWK